MTGYLYVTEARNDDDLFRALGSLAVRCPIPHGDVLFWGNSGTDTALRILVERKKLGDMAGCILSGRYLQQAQQAKASKIDVLVLVVEGLMRSSPDDDLIEIPVWRIDPQTLRRKQFWEPLKPAITYSRMCQYLYELTYLAGIYVIRSRDVLETASIIKSLWLFFQKPPRDHQSLKQIYVAPPTQVLLTTPSLARRIAVTLPGIGWDRSRSVVEYFGSVQEMVNADASEWGKIEGIGKKIAEKVVLELRRGK